MHVAILRAWQPQPGPVRSKLAARAAQLRALIIQLEQRRVSLCARMDLIEREIQQLQAAPQLKSQK